MRRLAWALLVVLLWGIGAMGATDTFSYGEVRITPAFTGLLGPAATPDAVVTKLHDAVVALAADPSYVAVTDKAGMTLVNSTPAEFATEITRGYEQWKAVVVAANIQTQ